MNKKLAVILTGPYRYIDHVISSLERIIDNDINYDIFIHIWEEDLGNKIRKDIVFDRDSIAKKKQVKSVTFAKAYSEEQIASRWGYNIGCHSTINAMFGMFTAINTQLSIMRVLPDYKDYSHVFRIRTDCALFIKKISVEQLNNKIIVSKNYSIPDSWISDHLMLASTDKFESIWGYSDINEFAKKFNSAGRNPEKMLTQQINSLNYNELLSEEWIRGKEYHIVYNPAKDDDPDYIKQLIANDGVGAIFKYTLTEDDHYQVQRINQNWNDLNKGYDSPLNKLKRLIKKVIYHE